MSSDRNSDALMMGQEYLKELAAGCASENEEHVDLSSLNDEVCCDYEELKLEKELQIEDVEIPPEEEKVNPDLENYMTELNQLFPVCGDEMVNTRRENMIELNSMGFSNFPTNVKVLDHCKDNMPQAMEIILNREAMVSLFGPNFLMLNNDQ